MGCHPHGPGAFWAAQGAFGAVPPSPLPAATATDSTGAGDACSAALVASWARLEWVKRRAERGTGWTLPLAEMFFCSLLVLKGIYHYWNIFPAALSKWKNVFAPDEVTPMLNPYCGWLQNPDPAPRNETMVEPIVCWYLQGNHYSRD